MHDVTVDLTGAVHAEAVQERVDAAVAGLPAVPPASGRAALARITLRGEVEPSVQVDPGRLHRPPSLDAWVVRVGDLRDAYDLGALAQEQTVRGQFVRDVQADPGLPDELRRRILFTGLRALDGRDDLAVV
jgi:hypothetical protein